ncbi:MAG: sigma-70 family RNA polymerase sigma factor [Afipia sp.]|nr:sigma-70 family RNA polymerase sigma factor [Afipia sp.]OJW65431.1 MAG: RNA polymerase subunit sigma-70 [Afipia sp. 64-13]
MTAPAELARLMASVAKHDQADFERLYDATRARLFGVVLRVVRDQGIAEDVLCETYVRVWNEAGQFDPGLGSPMAWMVAMARNSALDIVRKRGDAPTADPDAADLASDTPPPLSRRDMTDELQQLLECVSRLDADRQKLVLLAYYNGWSRAELAEKFGKSLTLVRTWLRRSVLDIGGCLGLA